MVLISVVFALVIALSSSGRDIAGLTHIQPGTRVADTLASSELMMLFAGVGGWLLFVYLRTSAWVRAVLLIGLSAAAVILAVARVSPLIPRV